MRYRDFEFYATPSGWEQQPLTSSSQKANQEFFCEIYHASDDGMANLLDSFSLREGIDIPAHYEPGLIDAVKKYIDSHYDQLLAGHETHTGSQKEDFLDQLLHQSDFNLLYQQKQDLVHALYSGADVPKDTLQGLIHFLDFIGDWAEKEGVFCYPDLEEKPGFVDELVALAEEELNNVGKISYFTADNKYLLMITVEPASDDAVNPGKEYYWLSCMPNLPGSRHSSFSGAAEYNDFEALRNLCEDASTWIEVQRANEHPPLDSMIDAASTRTDKTSSASQMHQKHTAR